MSYPKLKRSPVWQGAESRHFYRAGAMQADAPGAQHRGEELGIVVKATEKYTVHTAAA